MSKSKGRADVDTLLAERARFEAWLDQLLAKASKVPSHVVERVRGDYEARLAKVVEELRSRADDLRAETASLETKLSSLEEQLGALKDARAEDELRASVGEYDEGAWAAKSAEHDEGIRRVEGERDRGQADLSRVRQMLSETTRPSRSMQAIDEATLGEEPTSTQSTAADGASEAAREEFTPIADAAAAAGLPLIEPEPSARSKPAAVPPPAPELPTTRSPSPFDEIGFLRTVVGRATPMAGVEAPAEHRASVSQSAPVATSTPPDAPIAPPPATVATPAPQAVASPRVSGQVVTPAAMPSFDEPMLDETVAPVVDPEAEAKAAEAARTLKCQECGWMNYPTEWYCEKCGGELAAF